jgi:hypothetical protein
MSQVNETIGLLVDAADGKLKIYTRANANPRLIMLVWLEASAPYPNWA